MFLYILASQQKEKEGDGKNEAESQKDCKSVINKEQKEKKKKNTSSTAIDGNKANKYVVYETETAKTYTVLDRTDLQRTIVLTGLTAKVKRKAFRILCEKFGTVENIVYPVPEREEVTAFVRYKEYKGTIRAIQKIPGQKVKKSNTLSAVLLTKEGKVSIKKDVTAVTNNYP